MKIFPAIDIKDQKCVRLLKGNFENKKVYDLSPLDQQISNIKYLYDVLSKN